MVPPILDKSSPLAKKFICYEAHQLILGIGNTNNSFFSHFSPAEIGTECMNAT
jgi:hypothetical protein